MNYLLSQIPLGVMLKNENKNDEMVEILDALHKYVPSCTSQLHFEHPDTGADHSLDVEHFKHVLVGGDQLTIARVRSAQLIRANSNSSHSRLEGLVPSIQDWHAKLCFMQVYTTNIS